MTETDVMALYYKPQLVEWSILTKAMDSLLGIWSVHCSINSMWIFWLANLRESAT